MKRHPLVLEIPLVIEGSGQEFRQTVAKQIKIGDDKFYDQDVNKDGGEELDKGGSDRV